MQKPRIDTLGINSVNSAAISLEGDLYVWGDTKSHFMKFQNVGSIELDMPQKVDLKKVDPELKLYEILSENEKTTFNKKILNFQHISMNETQIACLVDIISPGYNIESTTLKQLVSEEWYEDYTKHEIVSKLRQVLTNPNVDSVLKFLDIKVNNKNEQETSNFFDKISLTHFKNCLSKKENFKHLISNLQNDDQPIHFKYLLDYIFPGIWAIHYAIVWGKNEFLENLTFDEKKIKSDFFSNEYPYNKKGNLTIKKNITKTHIKKFYKKLSSVYNFAEISLYVNTKINKICCGSNFTIFLTDFHEVFSWGDHSQGCLGHQLADKPLYKPKKISNQLFLSNKNIENTKNSMHDGKVVDIS